MKKIYIIFLLLVSILFISSCSKHKMTDNAYTLSNDTDKTNKVTIDNEYYFIYKGKLLVTGTTNKSIITICNIYYDANGNIESVSKVQKMILSNKKNYELQFRESVINSKVDGKIIEYVNMRQAISIYNDCSIIVDESYN